MADAFLTSRHLSSDPESETILYCHCAERKMKQLVQEKEQNVKEQIKKQHVRVHSCDSI